MIDTHIHLNDEAYKDNIDEIIKQANITGVNTMFVIGCDYNTSVKAIEIAHKYKNIYAIVGLHPSEVDKETDLELTWLKELLKDEKVINMVEKRVGYFPTQNIRELSNEIIYYFHKWFKVSLWEIIPYECLAASYVDVVAFAEEVVATSCASAVKNCQCLLA